MSVNNSLFDPNNWEVFSIKIDDEIKECQHCFYKNEKEVVIARTGFYLQNVVNKTNFIFCAKKCYFKEHGEKSIKSRNYTYYLSSRDKMQRKHGEEILNLALKRAVINEKEKEDYQNSVLDRRFRCYPDIVPNVNARILSYLLGNSNEMSILTGMAPIENQTLIEHNECESVNLASTHSDMNIDNNIDNNYLNADFNKFNPDNWELRAIKVDSKVVHICQHCIYKGKSVEEASASTIGVYLQNIVDITYTIFLGRKCFIEEYGLVVDDFKNYLDYRTRMTTRHGTRILEFAVNKGIITENERRGYFKEVFSNNTFKRDNICISTVNKKLLEGFEKDSKEMPTLTRIPSREVQALIEKDNVVEQESVNSEDADLVMSINNNGISDDQFQNSVSQSSIQRPPSSELYQNSINSNYPYYDHSNSWYQTIQYPVEIPDEFKKYYQN